MRLGEILGQERVVNALIRSVKSSHVAHAYIFEGVPGSGRRTTALALVQALFCLSPSEGDACGECQACRKVSSGNHPDLHFLEPLPDKRDISIEQVREMQQQLSLRPYEACRKACIIEPAERITTGAANALLKTLEEPSGHAVIILVATQADLLLPTIRSRCQQIRLSPLNETVLTSILRKEGMEAAKATAVAAMAEGSLDSARSLAAEDSESSRSSLLDTLAAVDKGSISTVFDATELIAGERAENIALFGIIISLIRDMLLMLSAKNVRISNSFMSEKLEAEASRFAPDSLMKALELAIETEKSIRGNVNGKLAINRFLIKYAESRNTVQKK